MASNTRLEITVPVRGEPAVICVQTNITCYIGHASDLHDEPTTTKNAKLLQLCSREENNKILVKINFKWYYFVQMGLMRKFYSQTVKSFMGRKTLALNPTCFLYQNGRWATSLRSTGLNCLHKPETQETPKII